MQSQDSQDSTHCMDSASKEKLVLLDNMSTKNIICFARKIGLAVDRKPLNLEETMKIESLLKPVLFFFLLIPFSANSETISTQKVLPSPMIKKVVMYKHGMGYFERRGKILDEGLINLPFKIEQMKDLLTSFFALGVAGII